MRKFNDNQDMSKKQENEQKEPQLPKASEQDHIRLNQMMEAEDTDMEELNKFFATRDWDHEFIEENGKYGLKTSYGKVLYPPIYDVIFFMSPSYLSASVWLCKDGKYALASADGKGTLYTDFEFDEVGPLYYFIRVRKGNKWGFICAEDGEVILPVEYDAVYDSFDGIYIFEKNGKAGIIDEEGNRTEAIFDEIMESGDGEPVPVIFNGKQGFVTEEGKFTKEASRAGYFFCKE